MSASLLGVFVMQHNHTKVIYGHVDVIRLKSKRHQLVL